MSVKRRSIHNKWEAQNNNRFNQKCNQFVKSVIEPKISAMLKDVAQKVVSEIDSIASIPNYTGNLRDSHGVGVYVDGYLASYIPTQSATRPQSSGFGGENIYNIWGTSYLNDALNEATEDFSSGIWLVIFAAVPYAFYINESNAKAGFFDTITNNIISSIRGNITTVK